MRVCCDEKMYSLEGVMVGFHDTLHSIPIWRLEELNHLLPGGSRLGWDRLRSLVDPHTGSGLLGSILLHQVLRSQQSETKRISACIWDIQAESDTILHS